jgi:hypothetical protein
MLKQKTIMKTQISTNNQRIRLRAANALMLSAVCVATAALVWAQQSPTLLPTAQAQSPPVPPSEPVSFLAWDADSKEYNATAGELTAQFTFFVTNISSQVVTITNLLPGCGCTAGKLPEQPWHVVPGASGPIQATLDLRGRTGRVSKHLTVNSSAGAKTLWLHVNIPTGSLPAAVQ